MINMLYGFLEEYLIFNLIVTLILGWIVYNWTIQSWLNIPPGPIGLPIFGNIFGLGKRAEITLAKLAEKYGPVFTIYMGTNRTIVLNSIEAINEAFIKNGSALNGRPHSFFSKFISDDKGMIFLKGENTWKIQRRFSSRALAGAGMQGKSIEERILEETEHLCEIIRKKDDQPFVLEDDLLLSIASVINGITMKERWSDNSQKEMQVFAKDIVDSFRKYGLLYAMLTILPWIRYLPFVKTKVKEVAELRNTGEAVFTQRLEEHIQHFDSNDIQDLVDLFLAQHYEKAPTFENLMQLVRLLSDLFIAGTETTTSSIRWIIFYLIKHPEIQQKVDEELQQALGTGGKVRLGLDVPYTRAVIQEGFRIRTTAPLGVPRRTTQAINLMGYHIPKNTQVIPNLWAVHNDPVNWPEPDKFIPERHLDENGKFVKSNNIISFSIGGRNCLGENLARSEVFLFIVSMLQRFEVLPNPENPNPPEEGHVGFVYSAPHYPIIMREK